ncbi:MAG: hypothetical protein IMZ62_04425, partial [Chloroflexi bacterium]|nr:hypothetical protein [Chloroflexota bacterium]
IVQEGSHDELIGRDGLYRQLYEMQSLLLAKYPPITMAFPPPVERFLDPWAAADWVRLH